jgi:tight adherence protein C
MLLLPILAFICASLLVAAAALALTPRTATIEQRLDEVVGGMQPRVAAASQLATKLSDAFMRIGHAAPKSEAEMGKLRSKLVCAGYRREEALILFLGMRVACALLFFLVTTLPFVLRAGVVTGLVAAGIGYLLPTMALGRMAKRRQHRLRLSLPDALDLMVVSVEAGLGLDQAIQRVADELTLVHPELADELKLVNLELRAGTARADALRNLANRTQVDDLSSLVTMLVQTDKFGTSVAQSLRVHSDTARTKRRQRAEEAAAKTGAKMVFPLVFCIFPAVWVVTIGPAAIKFVQVLGPLAQQQK